MASVIAAGVKASITFRSSTRVFHCSSSSAAWRFVAAQFGDQWDYAGVDAGHQPIGFLPLVSGEQPAGAAGQIDHVRPRC